jgi:hypothetical protein
MKKGPTFVGPFLDPGTAPGELIALRPQTQREAVELCRSPRAIRIVHSPREPQRWPSGSPQQALFGLTWLERERGIHPRRASRRQIAGAPGDDDQRHQRRHERHHVE